MSDHVKYPPSAGDAAMAASGALAELTGWDGVFVFPEHLLQRIWLRGDFDRRSLRLRDGRPVRLLRRGRWNRLAGPDFLDAEWVAGEGAEAETWRGDVEVHLRAEDWDRHRHAEDPAYARVVLHVVLFPARSAWTRGWGGRAIPVLELLPWLEHDLESYAADAAVEALAGRPFSRLREALAAVDPLALADEVERHAERRWRAKVALARSRVARLGWAEACHTASLEVLGYRFNREAMLAVAEALPLAQWRQGGVSIEAAVAAGGDAWRSAAVRPANRPRARLATYARWLELCPDWPERLAALADEAPAAPMTGGAGRRSRALLAWRRRVAAEIAAGVVRGPRFDTLVCDAWLPLLAARSDASCAVQRARWAAWPPGDLPAELPRLARDFLPAGIGAALGQGSLQGLLGWLAALGDPAPRAEAT